MRRKLSIICLVLIVLLFVIYFISIGDNKNMNYISIIDNKELVIDKPLPLSDEVGSRSLKANSSSNVYYSFKIESLVSKKSHYKLLLETKKGDKYIKDEYIKISLSDENDKIFKEYDKDHMMSLNGLNKFNDKYLLYDGSLKGNSSKKMIIRLWVSHAALYDDNLIFDGKLLVYSY